MGKIIEKTTENKTKGEETKEYCLRCKAKTMHKVMSSFDIDGSEECIYESGDFSEDSIEYTIDWSHNYQIIKCLGCNVITFKHLIWCSENTSEDDDGTSIYLYPERFENDITTRNYTDLPFSIERIYKETIKCFNNGNHILCAAGLRAIIDGICSSKNIKDGPVKKISSDGTEKTIIRKDLQAKIEGLHAKGLLTMDNANILHEHRFLGNKAIHELEQPTAEELKIAIEIIESTLYNIYDFPSKAAKLRAKRLKRLEKSTE